MSAVMVTKKKPAAAPAAEVAVAAPAASSEAKVKAPGVKIRDLVEKVVTATGAKKKGAKEIVEATLTELGEALARGDELNLPGFGRAKVAKTLDKDGTALLTIKLKRGPQKKTAENGKEALAEDGEDS